MKKHYCPARDQEADCGITESAGVLKCMRLGMLTENFNGVSGIGSFTIS